MERTLVKDLKTGKEVLLQGWVHELRDLAKLKFLLLRDMSGIIQCVIKDETLMLNFPELSLESVVELKGKVRKAKVKAETVKKDMEVEVEDFKILNKAEVLPIQINENVETEFSKRLDYRFLDFHRAKTRAIFRIQSEIADSFREFFYKKVFLQQAKEALNCFL
jgi:aspartyl-tRNA synthetase